MSTLVRRSLILLAPLVLTIIWALATYGLAGPASGDAHAMAIFRLLGFAYVLYLAVVFILRRKT